MNAPTAFGRVLPLNKAWLAKLPPEEVIEPDLPIIDTHHHLWAALPAALPQGDSKEDHAPHRPAHDGQQRRATHERRAAPQHPHERPGGHDAGG